MAKPSFPKTPTKISAAKLSDELVAEIEEISSKLNTLFERTECGNVISYLNKLYEIEKRKKARKTVLKKIKNIMRSAQNTVLAFQRIPRTSGGERITATSIGAGCPKFSRKGLAEEPKQPLLSTHEGKNALANIRKIFKESTGFWREIERHFADKPVTKIMEAVASGTADDKVMDALLDAFFRLPVGVSPADTKRALELVVISRFFGEDFGRKPPSLLIKTHEFIRESKNWRQRIHAYALMKNIVEKRGVETGFLENTDLRNVFDSGSSKTAAARCALLISLACDYQGWYDAIMRLLGVDKETAEKIIDDLVKYSKGETPEFLRSMEVLGGEGTVARLDFSLDGTERTLFFRFGDARSHALGYWLLNHFGLKVPEHEELGSSLCSVEEKVDGKGYSEAPPDVDRKITRELGRLLAACFILGIPDPNPTNFIIRKRSEVVKIDAESAPIGWNYYANVFIGGVSFRRQNDSFSFNRVMELKPGTANEIKAGFVEEIDRLRSIVSKKGERDQVCEHIEKKYKGAYLYRSIGDGITDEVILRFRKRLDMLIELDSDELFRRAQSGIDIIR